MRNGNLQRSIVAACAIVVAALASAGDAPHVVGTGENAKWTATTLKAATEEAQQKVLKGGRVATVTGEVVEVSCYLQLGKRGKSHIECATGCIENGEPAGIVDADGTLTILFAEEHDPRRDGDVDLAELFIPLLAEQVAVTGMLTENQGYRALFVQSDEVETMIDALPLDDND